ncbi:MAG: hypothetical protein WCJ70_01240 [bacterium]
MPESHAPDKLSVPATHHLSRWQKVLAIAMVSAGICTNLMFISLSIKWGCEMGKCGLWIGEWHYHDALWHIAVSRISFTSFPFLFPSAVGFELTSYNYLLGLILHAFELAKISAFVAYFYILPVVANVLFLHALVRYMRKTEKTPHQVLWILFFSYLASSFSYFLIFYNGDFQSFSVLKGFPVVMTLQPSIVLSNIQFYLSLSFFIYIFTDVIVGVSSRRTVLIHTLLLVLCIGLKIYTGIMTIMILTLGYSYWTYKKRSLRYVYHLGILAVASVCSYYIFYLPGSSYTKGIPFALYPLSIPHALTESPSLFYHQQFTLGRYYMVGLGKWSPRLLAYESLSAVLFVLLNMGTRIMFVFDYLLHKMSLERALLTVITITGTMFPIFFIQDSGGWYNSIQFMYVSIYTAGLLAADTMTLISKSGRFIYAISIVIIVALSVPNTLLTYQFLTKEKQLINDQQLKALAVLKNESLGVILSLPDGKNSSYVSALTSKQSYLSDDEQGALLKLPLTARRVRIDVRDCKILLEVNYLYLNNENGREFLKCQEIDKFQNIYDFDGIVIYKNLSSHP